MFGGMKISCPSEQEVRARAYQIFLARGGQPGHEMDDWLQAEYELMQLPIGKIAKLGAPDMGKKHGRKLAIVSLVQAAIVAGAEAMPHLR
jgi:hypothetical protein